MEKDVPSHDLTKLREALDVWEGRKVVLSRMSGMIYVEGAQEEELSEKDREVARLII
jgi:hypothetical protein